MDITKIELIDSWKSIFDNEFQLPYMQQLQRFLAAEQAEGKVIYPPVDNVFHAFNTTAFEDVKVVVLGQDPYHGEGQAHGLSFSVPYGIAVPPSLRNIYKELQRSLDFSIPDHGCLQYWAEQGVLLLNATLTVEQAQAGSHQNRGWENFTDKIIDALSMQRDNLVFMLWGSYAQKKGSVIDAEKHCVLRSVHPSPLSAHRGFIGNDHFVQANAYLESTNQPPIHWQLDPYSRLL